VLAALTDPFTVSQPWVLPMAVASTESAPVGSVPWPLMAVSAVTVWPASMIWVVEPVSAAQQVPPVPVLPVADEAAARKSPADPSSVTLTVAWLSPFSSCRAR
jgi:hypothetical protein